MPEAVVVVMVGRHRLATVEHEPLLLDPLFVDPSPGGLLLPWLGGDAGDPLPVGRGRLRLTTSGRPRRRGRGRCQSPRSNAP